MNHELFIRRTIELAENGAGFVSPNPKVGAVIICDGKIIAEGWHSAFGKDHAELDAVKKANRDNFKNCTIYVNLEPCSHFGKTPPCADMMIEKGFSRVVIATEDPNPKVAGKGIKKLRDAGIEVITDICREEALWCNRAFFKFHRQGVPYTMLKIAQTIDGCIALESGESKWISSEESRMRTHKLRSEYDAVLVGKTTAMKDNPLLTVRTVPGKNPLRVITDTNLSLPLDISLFKRDDNTATVVCCSDEASKSRKARNLSLSGINVLPIAKDQNGFLSLKELQIALRDNFDISSLMVEGGSGIFSSFIRQALCDELQFFIAPKIFGKCLNPFSELKIDKMTSLYQFTLKSVEKCGTDIHAILIKEQ